MTKRAVLMRMLKTLTTVLPCPRILTSYLSHFKLTQRRSKVTKKGKAAKMMALRILMKKVKALTATKRKRKKRSRKTRT